MPNETETVFPWSLAEEVFDLFQHREINVMPYRDLNISESKLGSRFRYLDEYVKFKTGRRSVKAFIQSISSLASRRLNKNLPFNLSSDKAPTVILQHDVDLLPDRTLEMLAREHRRGIFSSTYVFVEHAEGEDYEMDIAKYQAFDKLGFEIGYHLNAYERAGYDETEAYKLAATDLDFLNERFDITSYVPHGGISSSDGSKNNKSLKHKHCLKPLELTYNGNCILKEYSWSDGGVKKNTIYDPREFIKKIEPGTRAVMLMHPQYYGETLRDDWQTLPVSKEKWWRELWGL